MGRPRFVLLFFLLVWSYGVKQNTMPKKLTQFQNEQINVLYQQGAKLIDIATQLEITTTTCIYKLKKAGLYREPVRYDLDESFFDRIDTEEKAYWLGFLGADGGIYKGRISIQLAPRDKAHLSKLLGSLQANHPIREVSSTLRNGKTYLGYRTDIQSVKRPAA
jgi:hypothetical protein